MMNIRFVDTSIMTNILNIPSKNEQRNEIMRIFESLDPSIDSLILPLSTIIETGNHIAHIDDGRLRRGIALKFSQILKNIINEIIPWQLYGIKLEVSDIEWIASEFANYAQSETGIGDLCIIRQYNTYKESYPGIGKIMIWSVDSHLSSYYDDLTGLKRRRFFNEE